MNILHAAQAGIADKKGDALISIEPAAPGSGVQIELSSSMTKEYGNAIKNTVCELLLAYEVSDVVVSIQDKGAMDFTVRARLETALRGSGVGGIL